MLVILKSAGLDCGAIEDVSQLGWNPCSQASSRKIGRTLFYGSGNVGSECDFLSFPHLNLQNADFGWGPNSYFTFPKYGGTGNVWGSMAKKLPNDWFRFNSKVFTSLISFQIKRSGDGSPPPGKEAPLCGERDRRGQGTLL